MADARALPARVGRTVLRSYRASGADLPYGDPLRAHGVGMEGYFWRITEPDSGRVAIALIGVNRSAGKPWSTLGLASSATEHRPATLQIGDPDGGWADPDRVGAGHDPDFLGDDRRLQVSLGGDRLECEFADLLPWPRRPFGGSSVFQCVPALNQYWHPWLLGGRASGSATFEGETWEFRDAQVYAEKNWGREGFPGHWWWGQAQGFEEPGACVAFAGGEVSAGPLRHTVTALVVRLPDGRVVRLGDPVLSPVRAQVSDEDWRLSGRGFGWSIEVEASAPRGAAHVLPVPVPSQRRNVAGALEHLTGSLQVTVRRRGRALWRGTTRLAGLESGGFERTAAELHRRGLPEETAGSAP